MAEERKEQIGILDHTRLFEELLARVMLVANREFLKNGFDS